MSYFLFRSLRRYSLFWESFPIGDWLTTVGRSHMNKIMTIDHVPATLDVRDGSHYPTVRLCVDGVSIDGRKLSLRTCASCSSSPSLIRSPAASPIKKIITSTPIFQVLEFWVYLEYIYFGEFVDNWGIRKLRGKWTTHWRRLALHTIPSVRSRWCSISRGVEKCTARIDDGLMIFSEPFYWSGSLRIFGYLDNSEVYTLWRFGYIWE